MLRMPYILRSQYFLSLSLSAVVAVVHYLENSYSALVLQFLTLFQNMVCIHKKVIKFGGQDGEEGGLTTTGESRSFV